MGEWKGEMMGDVPYGLVQAPIPAENIYGIGVAGPPPDLPEEEETEAAEEETTPVQRENAEYSEETIGQNIDVEA
jgi:hypothetical protein